MDFCSDDQNFEIYLAYISKKADTVEALVSDRDRKVKQ